MLTVCMYRYIYIYIYIIYIYIHRMQFIIFGCVYVHCIHYSDRNLTLPYMILDTAIWRKRCRIINHHNKVSTLQSHPNRSASGPEAMWCCCSIGRGRSMDVVAMIPADWPLLLEDGLKPAPSCLYRSEYCSTADFYVLLVVHTCVYPFTLRSSATTYTCTSWTL